MSVSAELWFRTTEHGVLIAYANQRFPTPAQQHTPVLYVGTDGLLYGGFAMREANGPRQVVSGRPVNDGQWHHAVVAAAIDRQKMYLDGSRRAR
jgi:Concanavalin A-like lectin/glucanases superfamily